MTFERSRERLRVFNGRLVTLTGPGGVGKTRLAVEIGRAVQADFADGVRFVSLAAVRGAQDAPSAIVRALAIVSVSGETSEQALTRFLAVKDLLLVLDNVEHVLPAASQFVSDLLSACSTLTVLATSREALALQAEERYPVAPLALPEPGRSEDPETLAGIDAVALFCERARAHDFDFRLGAGNAAAVAEICRRVDGLPLAIELAAARCGLLSVSEIAERLDAALGALGGGPRDAPARQRTLRATIDWSHDLLSDAEQQCFAHFAVCAGGATVHAAETITATGLDTLDGLVAKSLLVRRQYTHAPTRLGMLETIRAYATEHFATAADNEAVRERHYRYFLVLAQRHATERALWGADGKEHLAQLDAENDNLHAALRWAVGQASAERALAITAPLGNYWFMRDRYADAVEWIDRALSLPGADAHPALRVRALRIKVWCLWRLNRRAEQPAALFDAEAIARQSGDPVILSQALQTRADLAAIVGRLDVADALADEALRCAEAADDEWEIASSSYVKAMAASTIAELRERVDRAATLLDEAGNVWLLADLLGSAAYLALEVGSDHDAKQFLHRMLPIARKLAHPYLWMMFRGNFGLAALLTGDSDAARHAFREELKTLQRGGPAPLGLRRPARPCRGRNGPREYPPRRAPPRRRSRIRLQRNPRRRSRTPLQPNLRQARHGVLRARTHAPRGSRLGRRRTRRRHAELRRRDRLRSPRAAYLDPNALRHCHATMPAFHAPTMGAARLSATRAHAAAPVGGSECVGGRPDTPARDEQEESGSPPRSLLLFVEAVAKRGPSAALTSILGWRRSSSRAGVSRGSCCRRMCGSGWRPIIWRGL